MARRIRPLFWTTALMVGCCQPGFRAPQSPMAVPAAPPRPPAPAPAPVGVDLMSRPLERIPVGTVIGEAAPEGWSHLVLIATPTLSAEDRRDAPKMAGDYARMFKFTLLADVRRTGDGPMATYQLRTLGRGFAIDLNGRDTIIDGNNVLGADLGLFGQRILTENETILDNDVLQVARTATMLLFDAKAVMRVGSDHVKRMMRHAVVVEPRSGRLATFVWLVTDDRAGGYAPVEAALQLLPANMREARLLSVKRDRFTLGIPSPDAFGLVRIPQGTAIPFTPELKRLGAIRNFTPAQFVELESVLRAAAFPAARGTSAPPVR